MSTLRPRVRERTAFARVRPPRGKAGLRDLALDIPANAAGDDAHRLARAPVDRLGLGVEQVPEVALNESGDDHAGTAGTQSSSQTSMFASL